MVVDGMGASLFISSETHPAADVTTVLGIEPDESAEAGEKRGRKRARPYSVWILNEPPGADEHNWESVVRLSERLDLDALATLAPHYEARVNWGGQSDATQGGFALPADALIALGKLGAAGVYMWATVYLESPSPVSWLKSLIPRSTKED